MTLLPTYDWVDGFQAEYGRLNPLQRSEFRTARKLFLDGLRSRRFSPLLRIKRVQGHHGIWELTWAPDGRATFKYGDEVISGEPHVIWRRVGTHEIFDRP